MMPAMPDLLAQVRELVAKASPGPWRAVEWEAGEWQILDAKGEAVATNSTASCYPSGCIHYGLSEEDARLAVRSRHALVPLVEALVAVLGEADPNWDDWTETDDRLLGDTPVGQGRKVLADLQEQLQEADHPSYL